jgi:hypothetical protein
VFFDLAACQSFHQPTRCARRKLYAIAFQPPPLRGRFMDMSKLSLQKNRKIGVPSAVTERLLQYTRFPARI